MTSYQDLYTASHLIAVGINQYADPRFMPLGNAQADAQTLAGILTREPYDFDVTLLLGHQATKSAVIRVQSEYAGNGTCQIIG
jgi:hypothetical protein